MAKRPTPAPSEITIVCTGNIARSPFAAALLDDERRRRDLEDVILSSCGVHGLQGRSAVGEMRDEASLRGIDLAAHRGAVANASALRRSDLIITMTEQQRRQILELVPELRDRTFTLKEFERLSGAFDDLPETQSAGERVRLLSRLAHGARAFVAPAEEREDVADPFGGSREGYRRCAAEIEKLVASVAPRLFGAEPRGSA